MGLFSFVGKLAGGLIRTAANKLTGGLSEVALKALKGRAQAKQAARESAQAEALYNKTMSVAAIPQLKRTEKQAGEGEGWKFSQAERTAKAKRYGKPKGGVGSSEYNVRQVLAARAIEEEAALETAKKTGAKVRLAGGLAGGLDLAAIASQWRAEGKPGAWKDYIRANTHIRRRA